MTSGEPLYEQRRIRGFSRRFGDCSGSTVFAALPDRRLVLTPEIRAFLGFLPDSVNSFPSTRKCALALGVPGGPRWDLGRAGCGVPRDGVLLARVEDHHGGSGPVRGRRGAVDLEPGRALDASVGDQARTGGRVGRLLPRGGAPGDDRGLATAVVGAGASGLGPPPAATPAEGARDRGRGGDRDALWSSGQPGDETGAELLPAECREGADGLRADRQVEATDREWSNRECDPPRGEPAVEGGEYLLAQAECGGGPVVAIVLQGGSLEPA